ncbi:MAG: hypothetical protein K6B70_03485 [Clostridia bacterium]|nr:hypothetical protein [Clostridia bacterium]
MSFNKDWNFLSKIGALRIKGHVIKTKITIVAILLFIALVVGIYIVSNNEYRKYGYTGADDNIVHDEYTGEIVPKDQIDTYDNSKKYIVNSKGEKVTIKEIKAILAGYKSIQGDTKYISEENKDDIDGVCNTLFKKFLDVNYEIQQAGKYRYQIHIIGKYEKYSRFNISTYSEVEDIVKIIVKDKYKPEDNKK